MKITRVSPHTGKRNTLELPITESQYRAWSDGKQLIQNAMPNLSADEREFILSGYLPGEFEAALGPEREDL